MNGLLKGVKCPVLKSKTFYITSDYKKRNPSRPNHNGIDCVTDTKGTDYIIATDKGVVERTGYDYSAGNFIRIKHDNVISLYFHLKGGSIRVKRGQKVKKGQVIAYMGNSGHSYGAHLHFEVRNLSNVSIDALPYLQGKFLYNKASRPTVGTYQITSSKVVPVRKGAGTKYTHKKFKDLTKNAQKQILAKSDKKVDGYVKGVQFNVLAVKRVGKDYWGRTLSGWVRLQQNTTKYAKKV